MKSCCHLVKVLPQFEHVMKTRRLSLHVQDVEDFRLHQNCVPNRRLTCLSLMIRLDPSRACLRVADYLTAPSFPSNEKSPFHVFVDTVKSELSKSCAGKRKGITG